ncbi:hypothetical protein CYPRO_0288 [Cyclonatronum proteinivorum]|uniref:Biopolymer transport protein ExbD n=1 Tax=Cyclonatronum proteinivorum TaxID=1457365 RepID=A0A345UGH4_9BACT|nr:hypothetical protein [Cyclonatronum proteinivorum]AXI99575.1 hypothetical protein CYPRO_0288 [Cyclonatronum proteinivorum]
MNLLIMKKLGLTTLFCLGALIMVYLVNGDFQNQLEEPRIVVITLDADNLIFLDGQRISFANLQKQISEIRDSEPLLFEIRSEAGSCIYRINDLTRFLHPDPVQFAHATPSSAPAARE